MAEKIKAKKKPVSADWLVQGALTKIGDAFDRLTGRGWKPSSSLATSELAERLKALVDAEAREAPDKRKFVPHNIALKMQWDKFSTDSETALTKLEHELLTALVDHINDRRYYTYAPISLTVKPDYFTNGVKLFASFDKTDEDQREVSLDVTVPNLKADLPESEALPKMTAARLQAAVRFEIAGRPFEKILNMHAGKRFSVGRTRENDLALDDPSVSKMHASLLLNNNGDLVVADTGSTNGTFIDGERIAYGKGIVVSPDQKLRFGTVNVELEVIERQEPQVVVEEHIEEPAADDTYHVGEFEFRKKPDGPIEANQQPAPTVPSIPIPDSAILMPLVTEKPAIEPLNGLENTETEISRNK
jgi:pSer/pThr/pTyr-binding forkhead associated (FHA) protein